MENEERIDLSVLPNGQLITDWHDEQIANLLCDICKNCKGWKHPEHKIDCLVASRFCG
jgi:hypothetical protein